MTEFINEYCMHDHTCGELRASDVDAQVTLTGWCGTTATTAA